MIKPEPMTLKMLQALEIFQACQQFEGYQKAVGDKSIVVPYDLSGLVRVAVAMNMKALRPIAESYDESIKALRSAHLPEGIVEDKSKRLSALEKFNAEVAAVNNSPVDVKLRRLRVEDLKLDTNPFPPNVLTLLAPILDGGDE